MVLADTSVWVRFLAGREPYLTHLGQVLDRENVAGHPLVYGELLMGDVGGHRKLLERYEQMHFVPALSHQEVISFVRKHGLNGRGVGWTDVHLLASALASHSELWTADSSLAELAASFRMAHVIR